MIWQRIRIEIPWPKVQRRNHIYAKTKINIKFKIEFDDVVRKFLVKQIIFEEAYAAGGGDVVSSYSKVKNK